jgi:hypothetical protein
MRHVEQQIPDNQDSSHSHDEEDDYEHNGDVALSA